MATDKKNHFSFNTLQNQAQEVWRDIQQRKWGIILSERFLANHEKLFKFKVLWALCLSTTQSPQLELVLCIAIETEY